MCKALACIAVLLAAISATATAEDRYCCVSTGQASCECSESRLCSGPCYYAQIRWSPDKDVILNQPDEGNFVYFTGCWALDSTTNKGDQNMQNLIKFGGDCETEVFSNVSPANMPEVYTQISKSNPFVGDKEAATAYLEYPENLQDDFLKGIDYSQQNLLNNCNFTRITSDFVGDIEWADLALFDKTGQVTPNEAHMSLCDESPQFGDGKSPASPINCAFLGCSLPRT